MRAPRATDISPATRGTWAARDRPASAAASSRTRGCDTGRRCGARAGRGRWPDTRPGARAGSAGGRPEGGGERRASTPIISPVKIYTKSGDAGETSLFDNTRVSKADPRVEAYGEVDELNAWLGAVRAAAIDADLSSIVEQIQRDLFAVGARLADPSA